MEMFEAVGASVGAMVAIEGWSVGVIVLFSCDLERLSSFLSCVCSSFWTRTAGSLGTANICRSKDLRNVLQTGSASINGGCGLEEDELSVFASLRRLT